MQQRHQIVLSVLGVAAWSGFLLGGHKSSPVDQVRRALRVVDTSSADRLGGLRDPKTVVHRPHSALAASLPPPQVTPNGHPDFESILEQYVPANERSHYLINIGARDGKEHDPTYPLLARGYDGILFEGDDEVKEALHDNVAALESKTKPAISWGFLTPDTVLERLAAGGARKDADVFKVDVDSFDAELVERILEGGYRPKAVMVEFNPDIAPPLAWRQMYSPHPFKFDKVALGNYGASASAWHQILTEKYGFGLVAMEVDDPREGCSRCEHNMWFVSPEILARRGLRPHTHEEVTSLFWETHHAARRVYCLHARTPCGLMWPAAVTDAVPGGVEKLSPLQARLKVSLAVMDPNADAGLRKAYHDAVVVPFLQQMRNACNCKTCQGGDPCLSEWTVVQSTRVQEATA